MATYKEIQEWVKQKYGFVPKTCWIAHVKEISGVSVSRATNRLGEERLVPCPLEKVKPIQAALKHFRILS